jgi:hypothetical protein
VSPLILKIELPYWFLSISCSCIGYLQLNHRLGMFENRMPRKVFESKREKLTTE